MQKLFVCIVLMIYNIGYSQKQFDIFFDFNKDVPNELSQTKINKWIFDNKSSEITRILGYCDSIDDSEYNKDLAKRRINTMVTIFTKNNIKIADKIELKAFGKDFKYSKNQSDNRKVEVFYNLIKDNNTTLINSQTMPAEPYSETHHKVTVTQKIAEVDTFEKSNMVAIVEDERVTLKSKFDKAKKGDLVRINNINFYFNSEKIINQSLPLLDELLDIMMNNPKLVIEIHGHICCNQNPNDTKLSYRRALIILKYLTKNGIPVNRMNFKGYGSNDPIYRLPEKNEKERVANRRVEILIVNK